MLTEIKLKLFMMPRRRLICLFSIPALFLVTVFLLNSLVTGWLSNETRTGHSKFVAVRQSDRSPGVLKYAASQRGWHYDELEKSYDSNKLMMLGEIHSDEDQQLRAEGNRKHAFNELISERLSLHRALPDTRHTDCKQKVYRSDLPRTSVIICFYNEAWSVLLRTIHSVLDRTPAQLLYEVVVVDDGSDSDYLGNKLSEYLWKLNANKIKLVRTQNREGLIRARMFGATVATGEALVFLDSHCEVTDQWLEPLLNVLADDPRAVAIPVIDIINPDTFEYSESPLVKGGFNWGLHFRWDQLPESYFKNREAYTNPIETPTMAGGLFAIYRKYFHEMGEYDSQLEVWGGENLEISFRIWLCGGSLKIVPCSRVGHVFRKRRPYGSLHGEDTMTRNSLRVAKVWMDDYIQHFFQIRPEAAQLDYGNITERLDLKLKLNCKPFSWYLKYVYPEQVVPGQPAKGGAVMGGVKKFKTNYIKHGQIKHKESRLCVQAERETFSKETPLVLAPCLTGSSTQEWYESDQNELILSKGLCLDYNESSKQGMSLVRLMKCHGSKGSQAWIWSIRHLVFQLYHPSSGKCAVPVTRGTTQYLTVEICSSDRRSAFSFETD